MSAHNAYDGGCGAIGCTGSLCTQVLVAHELHSVTSFYTGSRKGRWDLKPKMRQVMWTYVYTSEALLAHTCLYSRTRLYADALVNVYSLIMVKYIKKSLHTKLGW